MTGPYLERGEAPFEVEESDRVCVTEDGSIGSSEGFRGRRAGGNERSVGEVELREGVVVRRW